MSKILKRMQFNNGYGCQCCRHDWEESEWIDEDEMPTIKDFFENEMIKFDTNCAEGGCVGITYEKDGMVLFGVETEIYRAAWYFFMPSKKMMIVMKRRKFQRLQEKKL